MAAYYNEIDPYAAKWLRNLIAAGHIADGVVDERSIVDVQPDDLREFAQCHFFAGIGVWSHALRSAGWTDDRDVWTGSCPCQPFSAAGRGRGLADERHLWPAWYHLIRKCRPRRIYGEQVASCDALGWWDVVHDDLEDADYACGAFDLCAAGVGAPHIRQRLFWVADSEQHHRGRKAAAAHHGWPQTNRSADRLGGCGSASGSVADGHAAGRSQQRRLRVRGQQVHDAHGRGADGRVADGHSLYEGQERGVSQGAGAECSGSSDGFWSACDWIPCRDGKSRPVEPGTFPLAHGAPSRVGRLRAYGNAIVAPLAAEFVRVSMEVMP